MDLTEKANERIGRTVDAFHQLLIENLYHTHGQAVQSASVHDVYMALSYSVRDYLIERWRKTTEAHYEANPKFVYYLSAEYLPGKQLPQNLLYTDTAEIARKALPEYNINLDDFLELDVEPGLGNGGLGRLAACFIDSLATLDIPAVGYGIRYEFGIFKQTFEDGWQIGTAGRMAACREIHGNFRSRTTWSKWGFGERRNTYDDEDGNRASVDSQAQGPGRTLHDAGPGLRHQHGEHPAALAGPCHRGIRFRTV